MFVYVKQKYYYQIMTTKYLKGDIKHFLVNLGITLTVFIVYAKYGFLGWPHLLSVIFIHYSVLPLDDWLDKDRPFPFYILPLLAFSAYYFPLITVLAILGDLIVNLRAIIKKDNFLLERLEGLGNVPIYVLPLMPLALLNKPSLYLAASLFILFADSFHKIGHRETTHPQLMWTSGLACLFLVSLIFATPTFAFGFLLALTLVSLIPFRLLTKKSSSRVYSQVWFGLAGLIGFYYYLYFVV